MLPQDNIFTKRQAYLGEKEEILKVQLNTEENIASIIKAVSHKLTGKLSLNVSNVSFVCPVQSVSMTTIT